MKEDSIFFECLVRDVARTTLFYLSSINESETVLCSDAVDYLERNHLLKIDEDWLSSDAVDVRIFWELFRTLDYNDLARILNSAILGLAEKGKQSIFVGEIPKFAASLYVPNTDAEWPDMLS